MKFSLIEDESWHILEMCNRALVNLARKKIVFVLIGISFVKGKHFGTTFVLSVYFILEISDMPGQSRLLLGPNRMFFGLGE